jgi:large subunit ribosomal protein L18
MSTKSPQLRTKFRKLRTRRKLMAVSDRVRLSVYRSSKHIYAQIIDDKAGRTLAAVSTVDLDKTGKIDTAREVGRKLAEKALSVKVDAVVFDRGPLPYHGQVKALAEGAREGGLKF